jgi:periplasmic protein CpxP/Spy
MKATKMILGVIGFSLVLNISSASSQVKKEKMSRDERIELRVKKLDEKLDLTDAQEKQVREILNNHTAKLENLKAEKEKLKSEARKEKEAIAAEIKNVLSKEQNEKLEKMHSKNQDGDDKEENTEARLEKLKKKLDLNAEQTEKLRSALNTHLQKMREIRNQAKVDGKRNEAKEKMRAEKEQFRSSLKSILTPEQMEKLKNFEEGEGKGRGKGKGRRNR